MFTLNYKGRLLVLDRPWIMGIINITPDSFYAGSRQTQTDDILRKAEKMLAEGADILDIGGQSSRPGSTIISKEEEMQRVLPAIEQIYNRFPEAVISIDTFYADVARSCVQAGAGIVNDISAGNMDTEMLQTVAALQTPYIIMHMKGKPNTMQQEPVYNNLLKEVTDFFITKIDECKKAGIRDIIIDPGFGFGKTIAHNFELLRNLSVFEILNCAILLGVSRKSTIYKTLGTTAEEALNGTTVLNTIGLLNGANLLRVHDVKEAREAALLISRMNDLKMQ
jgi:dihydropteroate synthase